MDWEWINHIIFRETLHITSGAFCLLGLQAVWYELRRAGIVPKLTGLVFAAFPLAVVFGLVAVREPFDAQHDPPYKSVLDLASWTFGWALAVWLQVRYRERNAAWTAAAARQLGAAWRRRLGLDIRQ